MYELRFVGKGVVGRDESVTALQALAQKRINPPLKWWEFGNGRNQDLRASMDGEFLFVASIRQEGAKLTHTTLETRG